MKFLLSAMLSLSLFLPARHLYAQNRHFTFGLHAGFNLSNAIEEVSYIVADKKSKPGFQVGVLANCHFSKSLYLQSGLSLTTKGTRHEGAEVWIGSTNPPVTYYETTTRQTYLQVPLKVGYQLHLNAQSALFVYAGPYAAYGIGGKEIIKSRTVSSSENIPHEKITTDTFGDRTTATNGFTRWDYGLIFGLGTSYRKLSLAVAYEPGLANIGENKDSSASLDRTYKNRNLSLTVGYNF